MKKEKQQSEAERIISGDKLILIKKGFFYKNAKSKFYRKSDVNLDSHIDSNLNDIGENILFEGIDGSGNTHILKRIYNHCLDNYDKLGIFPIWIDFDINPVPQDEKITYSLKLYRKIALLTLYYLEENKSILISGNNSDDNYNIIKKAGACFGQFFGLDSMHIESALLDLERSYKHLEDKLTMDQKDIYEKDSGKGGASLNADSGILSGNISAESQVERATTSTKKDLNFYDYSEFILNFFTILAKILNCRHILLLLDGIYKTKGEYQTEIFRLLKLLTIIDSHDGSNFIYFFASVYPPYLMNYTSQNGDGSFSFDFRRDSSVEFVQMCELDNNYENFFTELTQKKWLAVHNNELNICDLFEESSDFLLAIYCSNGLPGRYFEILEKSYDNLRERSKEIEGSNGKISSLDIKVAAKKIARDILYSEELFDLDEQLKEDILSEVKNLTFHDHSKSIYFTIDVDKVKLVKGLISKGILHDKGRNRSKRIPPDYNRNLMMLDFSIAVNEIDTIKRMRSLTRYQLKSKAMLKNNFRDCPHISISLTH
jgi:hypothetical protein